LKKFLASAYHPEPYFAPVDSDDRAAFSHFSEGMTGVFGENTFEMVKQAAILHDCELVVEEAPVAL